MLSGPSAQMAEWLDHTAFMLAVAGEPGGICIALAQGVEHRGVTPKQ